MCVGAIMADTDTIVDLVLATVHPKLRERCNRDQIVALLEDLGAYDADGIYDVLSTRSDTTNRLLDGLAPEAFLSRLLRHVAGEPTIAAVSAAESSTATPAAPAAASSATASKPSTTVKQVSIGSMFGAGFVRKFEKLPSGERVLASSEPMSVEKLAEMPAVNAGFCSKGCGRFDFVNAGARATHEKSCRGVALGGEAAAAAANASAAAAGHEAAASAAASAASCDATEPEPSKPLSSDDEDEGAPPRAPGKLPKLRKGDGKPKQSGRQQGESRGISHTLYFRLEAVKTLRHFERQKKLGRCPEGAVVATSEFYHGLSQANISRWGKQEEALRTELAHQHRADRPQSKHQGKLPTSFQSKGARRMSLHPGRTSPFAACELELHGKYRLKRRGDGETQKGGQRVTGHWLRIQMKRLVRQHYGDHAADCFKASKRWLRNFARRFGISLRRKSNSKAEAIEVRLPKIRRWHARLRRRVRRGPAEKLHPKWGRWLAENRLAADQVGCNLRAGLQSTYDEKGTSRVWIAGSPADDGKRFCTLNMIVRANNGDPSKPRCGQPKLGIIFRGTGQKVGQKERDGYHPDVMVRFQKKAWADDELCEGFAYVELHEATAQARMRGERSVCFFDNLSGQTTDEHLRNCKRAACDRHLLPTGSTGELMLIDGGVGARQKNLMGDHLDEWLEQPGNLERWTTGPKEGGLHAWEKRVLISQIAGRAWETLCCGGDGHEPYDFEASARSMGMLMTADGSDDDCIRMQGLAGPYTFTDSDGGEQGAESEAEADNEEEADVEQVEEGEEGGEEDDEADDGADSSEEEDDTAVWACSDAPAQPPDGFAYAPCPPLDTEQQHRELIGRHVLVAHDSQKATGWYRGKIKLYGVLEAWKEACPNANFLIKYTKKDTDSTLQGDEARELTVRNYGPGEWWLLLDSVGE